MPTNSECASEPGLGGGGGAGIKDAREKKERWLDDSDVRPTDLERAWDDATTINGFLVVAGKEAEARLVVVAPTDGERWRCL